MIGLIGKKFALFGVGALVACAGPSQSTEHDQVAADVTARQNGGTDDEDVRDSRPSAQDDQYARDVLQEESGAKEDANANANGDKGGGYVGSEDNPSDDANQTDIEAPGEHCLHSLGVAQELLSAIPSLGHARAEMV